MEHGDIIVGCDQGTLITFNILRPPNALLRLGDVIITDGKKRLPEIIEQKKCF